MRSHISSKPKIYPEGMDVDVAGISGKVSAHYPGRSACLPQGYHCREAMGYEQQKSAEAIVIVAR